MHRWQINHGYQNVFQNKAIILNLLILKQFSSPEDVGQWQEAVKELCRFPRLSFKTNTGIINTGQDRVNPLNHFAIPKTSDFTPQLLRREVAPSYQNHLPGCQAGQSLSIWWIFTHATGLLLFAILRFAKIFTHSQPQLKGSWKNSKRYYVLLGVWIIWKLSLTAVSDSV